MNNHEQYEQIMKILILGDPKVGKTSLMKSFCNKQYKNNQSPTQNLQYDQKIMTISGKRVCFQIFDTSCNQNFKLLLPSLYNSITGIILTFSVDNRNSFNSIAVWMKQISSFVCQNMPILLVCNKADLNKKQVSQRQAQALSEAMSIDLLMVSAKGKINVEDTMIKLYQKYKKQIMAKKDKSKHQEKMSWLSLLKCNF